MTEIERLARAIAEAAVYVPTIYPRDYVRKWEIPAHLIAHLKAAVRRADHATA